MLTLTDNAVEAIRGLTAQPDLPEESGLRIATEGGDPPTLGLAVTTGPQAGDSVVETEGVKVYLDGSAAQVLDDKALDAEVNDRGAVRFRLAERMGPDQVSPDL